MKKNKSGNYRGCYVKSLSCRKKLSNAAKKQWKNLKYQKIMSESSKKLWRNPKIRNRIINAVSKRSKKTWKNVWYKKLRLKSIKGQWKNLEFRKLRSNSAKRQMLNLWKNLDYRKKMLIFVKKNWKNPEYRKLMSDVTSRRNVKKWKEPKYRKLILSKLNSSESRVRSLKSNRKGPNKFEKKVQAFLDSSYRIKFKYVGSGPAAILINGFSPDFINKRKKIIVLANGIYWHLGKYNIEINNKNKRIHERIKAAPFKEAGYKVIQIWEDEFNK